MHKDIQEVLIDEVQLRERITELGREISRDYQGKEVVVIGILRGAIIFMSDLLRAMEIPVAIDFMACSSYGHSTESSGVVRILKDLDESIHDRHVLIVEDVVDSGLTLKYIVENLRSRGPASLKICTLLDKPSRRSSNVVPDYNGFDVPDVFVVGYGLDYAEKYRNLPYIGVLRPEVYQK